MSERDIPGEVWKPVIGREDSYEVSDLGRVRSLARELCIETPRSRSYIRRLPARLLKPMDHNGSLCVTFCGEGQLTQVRIAAVVAEAFLGEAMDSQELIYLDGDRTNLAAANLTYGSHQELWANRRDKGKLPMRERHGRAKMTEEEVAYLRENPGNLSLSALGEQVGVTKSAAWRAARGKNWREQPLHPAIAKLVCAIAQEMVADDALGDQQRSRP